MSVKRFNCEVCRTINLAKPVKKPDMNVCEKYPEPPPCLRPAEQILTPTCIKVLNKEDYKKCVCPPPPPPPVYPTMGHGLLGYIVKAGLVLGAVVWTHNQGIWGDQREVKECTRRWAEYGRSFSSRSAPKFDKCGRVIHKETSDTFFGPLYALYKTLITSMFNGIAKFPTVVKCIYVHYVDSMEQKRLEDSKQKNKN